LMGEGARRADEGGAKVGRARALRQRTTEAEKRMWFLLRDRRFDALKFRRQVPIGRYVADFACYEAKVIIELDGSRHAGSLTDKVRDVDLRARGFEVVRVGTTSCSSNLTRLCARSRWPLNGKREADDEIG